MPYPSKNPETKHDIISPKIVSISSGKLTPLFESHQTIIQHVNDANPEMQKKALTVYMYDDAPSIPRKSSATLYFAGFCNLSSICSTTFDHNSFVPFDQMIVCHVGVKRADKAALDQKNLDNANKFTLLCNNLREHSKVALIQCLKTKRSGFLIPMDEHEDGYNFAAYLYIGENDVVERMLSHMERGGDDINTNTVEESDEPIWKPEDEDTGMDDNEPKWEPEEENFGMDDNEPKWKPEDEGDDNDNDNDDTMWKPDNGNSNGNGNGNDEDTMWKPEGDNNNDNDDTMWQPDNTNNDNDDTMWQPDNGNDNDADTMWQPDNGNDNDATAATTTTGQDNDDDDGDDNGDSTFHKNSAAHAADKFYSGLTRNLDTRGASILLHMRNFNGWVKATQIAELDPRTTLVDNSNPNSKKRKRMTRHPLRILDLACGKGGDLGKWVLHNRGILSYVGSDVARGSLVDAALRARNMREKLKNKCTFICADLGDDVPGRPKVSGSGGKMQKLLSWSLQNDNGNGDPIFKDIRGGGIQPTDKFDVISIQFAIHYMMSSEKRARRFFQTVSELLDIGGNLIATTIDTRIVVGHMMNTGRNLHFDDKDGDDDDEFITIKVGKDACQLKFHRDVVKRIFASNGGDSSNNEKKDLFGLEYYFKLTEGEDHASGVGQAVSLAEWLTPLPVLEQLAEEAGLTLESASNFHDFFEDRKDPNLHHAAHSALYNMNVLNWRGSLSDQEWDISRMYMAVKFRKDRESTMVMDDDGGEEDDDDDDEEEEINQNGNGDTTTEEVKIDMSDPKMLKLYMKAMPKARMSYKGDWNSLPSDERKKLINVELRQMM